MDDAAKYKKLVKYETFFLHFPGRVILFLDQKWSLSGISISNTLCVTPEAAYSGPLSNPPWVPSNNNFFKNIF